MSPDKHYWVSMSSFQDSDLELKRLVRESVFGCNPCREAPAMEPLYNKFLDGHI